MLQTRGYCIVWCIFLLSHFLWYSLPYPLRDGLADLTQDGWLCTKMGFTTHGALQSAGPNVEQSHWSDQCYHWAVVDGVTCSTACVSFYSRRICWLMLILRDQCRCWSLLTSVMPITSTTTRTSIDWWAMQSLLHRSWSLAALPVCFLTFGLHHFQIYS